MSTTSFQVLKNDNDVSNQSKFNRSNRQRILKTRSSSELKKRSSLSLFILDVLETSPIFNYDLICDRIKSRRASKRSTSYEESTRDYEYAALEKENMNFSKNNSKIFACHRESIFSNITCKTNQSEVIDDKSYLEESQKQYNEEDEKITQEKMKESLREQLKENPEEVEITKENSNVEKVKKNEIEVILVGEIFPPGPKYKELVKLGLESKYWKMRKNESFRNQVSGLNVANSISNNTDNNVDCNYITKNYNNNSSKGYNNIKNNCKINQTIYQDYEETNYNLKNKEKRNTNNINSNKNNNMKNKDYNHSIKNNNDNIYQSSNYTNNKNKNIKNLNNYFPSQQNKMTNLELDLSSSSLDSDEYISNKAYRNKQIENNDIKTKKSNNEINSKFEKFKKIKSNQFEKIIKGDKNLNLTNTKIISPNLIKSERNSEYFDKEKGKQGNKELKNNLLQSEFFVNQRPPSFFPIPIPNNFLNVGPIGNGHPYMMEPFLQPMPFIHYPNYPNNINMQLNHNMNYYSNNINIPIPINNPTNNSNVTSCKTNPIYNLNNIPQQHFGGSINQRNIYTNYQPLHNSNINMSDKNNNIGKNNNIRDIHSNNLSCTIVKNININTTSSNNTTNNSSNNMNKSTSSKLELSQIPQSIYYMPQQGVNCMFALNNNPKQVYNPQTKISCKNNLSSLVSETKFTS